MWPSWRRETARSSGATGGGGTPPVDSTRRQRGEGRALSDVVVVGAGVAGLTAAVRLAERGRRVVVVAHGVGSTHLAPGRVDVLARDAYGQPVDHPIETLSAFLDAHPAHPYGHVGESMVAAASEWFRDRLGYVGSVEENVVLPTAVGAPKRSALVPENAADGDLRGGGRFLIVGLEGLKDFFPELCAANLQRVARVRTQAAELRLPLDGERDVSPLGFARRFDDERFRETVAREVRRWLAPGERVGFPAVLGLRDAPTVWRDLADRLRTSVFEIPTLPPSVPGIRLYDALCAALRAAGGRLVIGSRVVGARTSSRRVDAVVAEAAGRAVAYAADAFVLATGGFASGGLELSSDGEVRETVLGLAVAGVPASGERFSPEYFGQHPFARVGLAVDELLRPLDDGGSAAYENLHAAGATLGGAEPWREGSGDGISVATGFAAAEAIIGGGSLLGGAEKAREESVIVDVRA
jgi:glycerol-3-phosphate dehydrogenase subunit B